MRSVVGGFTLGVLLLQQQAKLMSMSVLLTLSVLALLTLFWRSRLKENGSGPVIHFFCATVFGWCWAGLVAIQSMSHQLDPELEERDITVVGVVTSLPAAADFGQRFQFQIERIITAGVRTEQVPEKILLSWYDASAADTEASPIHPGERWQFNVRLRRPHGLANPHGFDMEVWMLEQGLGATGSIRPDSDPNSNANRRISPFVFSVNNCIELAREQLRDRIQTALSGQRYAAIIVALVIGDQNAIAQDDWQVFARTGVSHLVAISGLHISMVAGMASAIMLFLWRHSLFTRYPLPLYLPAQKAAALFGLLVALLYVALAGFGVPAQRTLMMITVYTALMWWDRQTSVVNALCMSLGLVLLLDPWAVLWPGFWLSFCAVGFIFYASLGRYRPVEISEQPSVMAHRWLRLKSACANASGTQYAITLGLIPLTLLFFNQVSLISPIANAVAIPVVSLLVMPLALLGSIAPGPAGVGILTLAHFILQILIAGLAWLSEFSWAIWQAARPDFWMFVLACLGTGWMLAPKGWPLRWAGLGLWMPLCLNPGSTVLPGEFRVTALDVGQGMALLIETAEHRLLYDTGPAYSPGSDAGSRVIYPYLKMRGIDRLDGLMISHNDSDHSGGALSLLQQVKFDWVSSSLKPDSPVVLAAQQTSQHGSCLAGQHWMWDGIAFEVLHPTATVYESSKWKPNARSCTLRISNGLHSMLLAGDIEAIQEDELVNSIPEKLPVDVLVAPHHGSGTSSTTAFLNAVHPRLALFLLGYHNRYHHPKELIWQRYADMGITRLRSDQAGAITLHFDAEISVDEYRQSHARYWYAPVVSDYIGTDHLEDAQ